MNNKFSNYIYVDFYFDNIEVSNKTKNILYEVLNKLIDKLPDYTDFISASLSIFILLTPLQYTNNDIHFNSIQTIDIETNKTLTFNLKCNYIIYNNTHPYIIYELDKYTIDNYDKIILNSFDWFNYYHKQYLKYINKNNN